MKKEIVRRPSLDSMPKGVHAPERGEVRGEEVRPVVEYRNEEAIGDMIV